MAIKIDINASKFGVPFAGAYFRITSAVVIRQREGGPKFSAMLDVTGYGTDRPTDETESVDARRYYAPLENIESQEGAEFLSKCYAWVMLQDDMSGSVAV